MDKKRMEEVPCVSVDCVWMLLRVILMGICGWGELHHIAYPFFNALPGDLGGYSRGQGVGRGKEWTLVDDVCMWIVCGVRYGDDLRACG